ncbi:MAG: phytanoyl-CoA dioxygenase family protein [Planctomycetes bacterium]|nr:phytanoyl-CoA dioxygenase family protein [Planctomycetota bacterium]
MLDATQIDHFLTQGYVAVPEFFSARETAALQAEVRRLQDAKLLRNVATEGDGATPAKAAVNLQICPIGPVSPLILALRFNQAVTGAVSSLIGDPVAFVLDQIFLKPGGSGAGTRWHQDNAYFKQPVPTRSTGMWIAVHEATRANGTMHVVPRSHARLEAHERDPGSDHHIYAPQVRDEDAVAIELPAGGALFFNFGVLHCTHANTTARERAGLALHFINGEHADPAFVANATWLSGPQATGGERELGRRISGTWEAEVARALAAEAVGAPA